MHSPEIPNKHNELKTIFSALMEKIDEGFFNEEIMEFYKYIQTKYSHEEYGHCTLWHLIIGSTPDQTDIHLDTPGGEIEDFIRNKLPQIAENNS